MCEINVMRVLHTPEMVNLSIEYKNSLKAILLLLLLLEDKHIDEGNI